MVGGFLVVAYGDHPVFCDDCDAYLANGFCTDGGGVFDGRD